MNQQKIGPWTRVSSELVYENPWISVSHEEVIRPDQKAGIYGRIHFKMSAVGVVAFRNDGCIAFVGQHRYPLDVYSWELPEGGCDSSEDELIAIQRELSEETGAIAQDWVCLLPRFHLSNSVTDEFGSLWLAKNISEGSAHPEGCEELNVKWIPFDEALLMISQGEITDAITIMGLLLAQDYIKKNTSWVTWKR
jgi:8-oxo-dGTP pyrophosphatase MutT (NUDIX family)